MGMPICDHHDCINPGPDIVEAAGQFTRVCPTHTKPAIRLLKGLHPGQRVTQHHDPHGTEEKILINRGLRSLTDPRPAPAPARPPARRLGRR